MIILGINNRTNIATLTSTATYAASLPLANLKTAILPEVARTTTTDLFTITANLSSQPARSIGALAIAAHNLSRNATIQYQTYQNTTEVDDSGVLAVWPYLPEEHPHWQAHTYTAEIIDDERISQAMPTHIYFLPANTKANKVIITITDESNSDGYIQLGRLFIGEQIDPELGEDYGKASWGLLDYSQITTTDRHILYSNTYKPLRTVQASFEHLTDGEAQGALQTAQTLGGLTGEILIAPRRPTYQTISGSKVVDSFWFSRAFLARQTAIDPLTTPYLQANTATLNLEEIAS